MCSLGVPKVGSNLNASGYLQNISPSPFPSFFSFFFFSLFDVLGGANRKYNYSIHAEIEKWREGEGERGRGYFHRCPEAFRFEDSLYMCSAREHVLFYIIVIKLTIMCNFT